MNQIAWYISTHPEIKEVILLCGTESKAELVADICRLQPLKKLLIFTSTKEQKKNLSDFLEAAHYEEPSNLPKEICLINREELLDYSPSSTEFALVFDSLSKNEEILPYVAMAPKFLIGTLCKDQMNAFTIWEKYRKVSDEIHILSYKKRNEVLHWERSTDNNIELSVIFPMYNVAKYLPRCIETTTAWKAEYIEYLFVDDGSPDNCSEIVEQYAKADPRIKLLRKQNGGCASARQYGLEHAKGRYIGFIDPDDYTDPSMFRKLLTRAITGSYEISYCGYNELYESTGETMEVEDPLGWPYNEGTEDPVKINELIANQRVAIWRGIYSKDLIQRSKIHFYLDLPRFDDLPFKVETLEKARSVVAIPEYLYYYRMQRPGQDVAADDERLYVHFRIFEYLDAFARKCSDRNQLDYLQITKFKTHLWALKKIRPEFAREYCKKTRSDLNSNFGFAESCYIFRRALSRKEKMIYLALELGAFRVARRLTTLSRSHRNDEKHAIEQLSKLQ